jgi:hypothetical protein
MVCCCSAGGEECVDDVPPAAGGARVQALGFHEIHSEHIQLSLDGRTARRVESFCKGICFSNRPVAVNERIYVRISEVCSVMQRGSDTEWFYEYFPT